MARHTYKEVLERLEKETILTCVVDSHSVKQVRRNITHAKNRAKLPGRLAFSETEVDNNGHVELTITLLPPPPTAIHEIKTGGDL